MAITIITQPPEISFSRNPNWWGFKTDNLYSNAGVKSVCLLSFPNGPMSDGEAFDLLYNGKLQTFTAKDYPDDSGTQILSGKDHPLYEDLTLLEWCNLFISELQCNFLISRDYTLELDLTGIDPRVKISALKADPIYDPEISIQTHLDLTFLANGIKKTRHPSFGIWMQLLVSNDTNTGFEIVLTDTFLDVNDEGEAFPNLSQTLTQSIIGIDKDFDQPDPALPVVQRNYKSCRRFYIRYGEAYGSTQAIKKINQTEIKWVLLGGTGKAIENNYSIPYNFLVDGFHRFLKQEPVSKNVTINQCEWLSLVWLQDAVASIKLRVKVYFTEGLPAEFDAFTSLDIAKYDKITFPSGPTQLNLQGLYLDRVVAYYEIWVTEGGDRVSEIRTYTLNYSYDPYAKWLTALSSLGGYDTFYLTGKGNSAYDLVSQKAKVITTKTFKFEQGEVFEFDTNLDYKETIVSGWLSKRELIRYRDFFLSWNKFQVKNGRSYPIMLNSKSIEELQEGKNLFSLEFEIGYRFSEQSWTESDEALVPDVPVDVSQFWPLVSNPDPDNWDALYYRKTQTYNIAELDGFINALIATEAAHHAAQQGQIDALYLALVGKSNIDHLHEGIYVTVEEYNEAIIALANSIFYKGKWAADYSVAPEDEETLPGYFINDIVDFAGTFWRSLFGDDEEPNEAIPGTDPTKWEKIIEAKTQLSVTEPVTLNWQAGLIPDKTYTWAQKYGNDLPGTAGAWWDNGTKWERFDGFQMDPTYDGATLLTVAITADLYPVKINLI